jgi:WD40 repeat protein
MMSLRASLSLLFIAALADAQATPNAARGSISLHRPVLALGDEASGGPQTFGNVYAIAFDRRNSVYVLDASDNSIRVFDERGTFVARTGRSGRGPGDLARPLALLHDGDSTLVVVDDINGLVTFRTTQRTIRHLRTAPLPFRARSACFLDRTLLLTGYAEGHTIHTVTSDLELDRSFGIPFPVVRAPGARERVDTVAALLEWANRGALLVTCRSTEPRIVTVQTNGPGVRAYAASGQDRWLLEIDDYRGDAFAVAGPGRGTIVWGEDATYSAVQLSDSLILMQIARRQTGRLDRELRQARGTARSRRSIVVHARTGRVVAESQDLPIVLASNLDRVATLENEPFPRIVIRQISIRTR